jgi:hypothetical protein
MHKLLPVAIAAIWLTSPVAADAAPVTWNFYETGCVAELGLSTSPCKLPPQPYAIASLTLPGPTSSGSAQAYGYALYPNLPAAPPILTGGGNDFTFVLNGTASKLTPSDLIGPGKNNPGYFPDAIDHYDISWTEIAGQLTKVSVYFLTEANEISVGLNGGFIGSDFMLGGCNLSTCDVTGYWQSDLAISVPEPMSAVLLITGLLGVCLARRCRVRFQSATWVSATV